MAGFGIP